VIYLTILCVLQLVVVVYVLRDREREREADRTERRELTTRVQRPEFTPPAHAPARTQASKPHPNLAKIGGFAQRDGED
jgi:hypothetical protein